MVKVQAFSGESDLFTVQDKAVVLLRLHDPPPSQACQQDQKEKRALQELPESWQWKYKNQGFPSPRSALLKLWVTTPNGVVRSVLLKLYRSQPQMGL